MDRLSRHEQTIRCAIIAFIYAASAYLFFAHSGSDVVGLSALGNNIVVINTMKAATDLFEKRSSMYSDRCV